METRNPIKNTLGFINAKYFLKMLWKGDIPWLKHFKPSHHDSFYVRSVSFPELAKKFDIGSDKITPLLAAMSFPSDLTKPTLEVIKSKFSLMKALTLRISNPHYLSKINVKKEWDKPIYKTALKNLEASLEKLNAADPKLPILKEIIDYIRANIVAAGSDLDFPRKLSELGPNDPCFSIFDIIQEEPVVFNGLFAKVNLKEDKDETLPKDKMEIDKQTTHIPNEQNQPLNFSALPSTFSFMPIHSNTNPNTNRFSLFSKKTDNALSDTISDQNESENSTLSQEKGPNNKRHKRIDTGKILADNFHVLYVKSLLAGIHDPSAPRIQTKCSKPTEGAVSLAFTLTSDEIQYVCEYHGKTYSHSFSITTLDEKFTPEFKKKVVESITILGSVEEKELLKLWEFMIDENKLPLNKEEGLYLCPNFEPLQRQGYYKYPSAASLAGLQQIQEGNFNIKTYRPLEAAIRGAILTGNLAQICNILDKMNGKADIEGNCSHYHEVVSILYVELRYWHRPYQFAEKAKESDVYGYLLKELQNTVQCKIKPNLEKVSKLMVPLIKDAKDLSIWEEFNDKHGIKLTSNEMDWMKQFIKAKEKDLDEQLLNEAQKHQLPEVPFSDHPNTNINNYY